MMQWAIEPLTAATAAPGAVTQAVRFESSRAAEINLDPSNGAASGAAGPGMFANLVRSGISEVNSSLSAAEHGMAAMAAGKPVELHEVMIHLERARLSVQTFVQVRNSLIGSYQDLMRMQL
jgi:flagellar hook-basal body complex protein FliE